MTTYFAGKVLTTIKATIVFLAATAFILCFSFDLSAQERPKTDVRELNKLAEKWEGQDLINRLQALQHSTYRALPLLVETPDGNVAELVRFNDGHPEYYTTHNVRTAISSGTNHIQEGGRTHLNLNGEDMVVGVWDQGGVLQSHRELVGRVLRRDDADGSGNHATHVSGTMVATGLDLQAKGMANMATLWAYDWHDDGSEMARAAGEGMTISNHSYGSLSGWHFGSFSGNQAWHWFGNTSISQTEDYKFGYYDERAANFDQLARLAPNYLIVFAAGNDRNDVHSGLHYVWVSGEGWVQSSEPRDPDGGEDGYNSITTYSTAKNILTVGATRTVIGGYQDPSDVVMSDFSGWGPTDDGRIKPDLVGDGVDVLSSGAQGNSSYYTSSGTSMAAPNVSGSLLLVQELHEQLTGDFLWGSSMKGLAIHTANQTGVSAGPDYEFGWGLLNAEAAATLLLDPYYHTIHEEVLNTGGTYEIEFYGNGTDEVKATLCWMDPQATPHPLSTALNNPALRLINDLDMRITAVSGEEEGTVYFPYILDPSNPSAPATTGDNFRDNVEVIYPGVLPPGQYVLSISHKGSTLQGNNQSFSLILSAPPSDCSVEVSVIDSSEPTCFDSPDGEVVLEVTGGEAPYTYSLDGINFQESNVLNPLENRLKYFYAKDANGCTGSTTFFLERPAPENLNVNFSGNASGPILTLNNQSSTANYLWDFGDGNTSDVRHPTHTYEEPGIYEVCLTVFTDCFEGTICKEFEIFGAEIPEGRTFTAYPNPASHSITIEMLNVEEGEEIHVYNMLGQLIESFYAQDQIMWDISGLPAGMYLIQRDKEEFKFIKQ